MSLIATEDKKTLGWCNSGYLILLVISYTFVSTYVFAPQMYIYMHMHILYTSAQICTHIYTYKYVCTYVKCSYMYIYIYICIEYMCIYIVLKVVQYQLTYLIMKTKPSFVVFLVFTADYQTDWKGMERNHHITLEVVHVNLSWDVLGEILHYALQFPILCLFCE